MPFMQQKFTPNQLIQYLYNETGVCDTLAIEERIDEDIEVRETYESLADAYRQLPKVKFSPSAQSIRNILRYSEHTALTEQA
jgi:hypothetical protein